MTILPVRILRPWRAATGLLDDFAAAGDELLLTEPNEHERQGMRAAMKRNAPDFTSGQFFALRRGTHFAAATSDGLVEAQDFRQIPSPATVARRDLLAAVFALATSLNLSDRIRR
jgi:hypothetical protein